MANVVCMGLLWLLCLLRKTSSHIKASYRRRTTKCGVYVLLLLLLLCRRRKLLLHEMLLQVFVMRTTANTTKLRCLLLLLLLLCSGHCLLLCELAQVWHLVSEGSLLCLQLRRLDLLLLLLRCLLAALLLLCNSSRRAQVCEHGQSRLHVRRATHADIEMLLLLLLLLLLLVMGHMKRVMVRGRRRLQGL